MLDRIHERTSSVPGAHVASARFMITKVQQVDRRSKNIYTQKAGTNRLQTLPKQHQKRLDSAGSFGFACAWVHGGTASASVRTRPAGFV